MCYASCLVTIFFWAWLSSCVFLGPSGSIASAKGDTRREGGGRAAGGVGGGSGVIRRLFNFSKLQKVSFPSIFADATFFLLSARLIHYRVERRRRRTKWSSRCESSLLCESALTIHYWCRIFVIRTSLLHYAYRVHWEYHHLPALMSMRTFRPLSEPPARGAYGRHFTAQVFLSVKPQIFIFFFQCPSGISVSCDCQDQWDGMSCRMLCPL